VLCERELPCDARLLHEIVTADDAGKAASLRRAGDVDELARRERVDTYDVAVA
jgi:hypothetical protein